MRALWVFRSPASLRRKMMRFNIRKKTSTLWRKRRQLWRHLIIWLDDENDEYIILTCLCHFLDLLWAVMKSSRWRGVAPKRPLLLVTRSKKKRPVWIGLSLLCSPRFSSPIRNEVSPGEDTRLRSKSHVAVLVICKSCLMSPSNILSSTRLEPHERHGKNQNEIYAKTNAV